MSANIAIKGTRSGLLLTLEPETPFGDLLNALAERLAEAPTFFRGASLTVDTSQRKLRVSERLQLERLLAHYQMSVAALEKSVEPRREARTIALTPPETPVRTTSIVTRAAITRQLSLDTDSRPPQSIPPLLRVSRKAHHHLLRNNGTHAIPTKRSSFDAQYVQDRPSATIVILLFLATSIQVQKSSQEVTSWSGVCLKAWYMLAIPTTNKPWSARSISLLFSYESRTYSHALQRVLKLNPVPKSL
nr:hypothetical protein [Ktedonospora formicarum]